MHNHSCRGQQYTSAVHFPAAQRQSVIRSFRLYFWRRTWYSIWYTKEHAVVLRGGGGRGTCSRALKDIFRSVSSSATFRCRWISYIDASIEYCSTKTMKLSHACAFVCSAAVFWTTDAFAVNPAPSTAASSRPSTDLGLFSKLKEKLGSSTKRGRGDGYGKE